jgi:hypothetical protein
VFLLIDLREGPGSWISNNPQLLAVRKKLSGTYANRTNFPKSLFLTINLTV